MYSRLWGFMTNNPIKFKQIVSAIPYAHHWKNMACKNFYLYKIYYAKDKLGNIRSLYTSDAEGLLRFIRNAIAHSSDILAKYRISEWEISDIISSIFPSLLGSLQKALAESGEIKSPEVKLAKHMMG
jgi:hypothetical protein